jgi:hypothetical protein
MLIVPPPCRAASMFAGIGVEDHPIDFGTDGCSRG